MDAILEANRFVQGDFSQTISAFREAGFPAPSFAWEPKPEDLGVDLLRTLLTYWEGLPRGSGGLPRANTVDPMDMRKVLGYVLLVDCESEGTEFRYRLYGSRIAEISGFDATGELISESTTVHPTSRTMFQTVYRAVFVAGKPLYSQHEPAPRVMVMRWHRLVMPLEDSAGNISRFLVGNVPTRLESRTPYST